MKTQTQVAHEIVEAMAAVAGERTGSAWTGSNVNPRVYLREGIMSYGYVEIHADLRIQQRDPDVTLKDGGKQRGRLQDATRDALKAQGYKFFAVDGE